MLGDLGIEVVFFQRDDVSLIRHSANLQCLQQDVLVVSTVLTGGGKSMLTGHDKATD